MARKLNKLKPADVLKNGPGMYNDGEGLYLLVKPSGSRSWIYRFRDPVTRRNRDKGLGSCQKVSLMKARELATGYRADRIKGIDPIDAPKKALAAARVARAQEVTFQHCADAYIESHKASWRNEKHAKQWAATLSTYCAAWTNLPVQSIDTNMVFNALKPIWSTKTVTATRVLQRIAAVLDWATVSEFRKGDNPARWRGHLDKKLPEPTKIWSVKHRAALPHTEIIEFMAELGAKDSLASKALALQILTATRPGEAVSARWGEFDMAGKVWTIPKERMKSHREHKVPLAPQLLAVLKQIPGDRSGYLFPGVKERPITTAAMMKLLKSTRPELTCHGFRSTFRDWAAEKTSEGDVAEAALAHVVKNQTEAAYFRSNLLDKRRKLMDRWAKYCYTPQLTPAPAPSRP